MGARHGNTATNHNSTHFFVWSTGPLLIFFGRPDGKLFLSFLPILLCVQLCCCCCFWSWCLVAGVQWEVQHPAACELPGQRVLRGQSLLQVTQPGGVNVLTKIRGNILIFKNAHQWKSLRTSIISKYCENPVILSLREWKIMTCLLFVGTNSG